MKFAVIDLSSTGVSTVVAEGDRENGVFEAIYKDRSSIAVADYFEGRSISARGIEKLIDALIAARSTVRAMSVDECYVVSTAALRNIDNIEEVAVKIRMRTGIVINYLDAKTEAYCDFMSNRKYAALGNVVLIDIGGGSVELCDLSKPDKNDMMCLDFGTIKLRSKYVADIYPTEDEAKRIKKYVRKKADETLPRKHAFTSAVLVGSINDAICATYREYCERKKLGAEFTYDKYKKFVTYLLTSPERTQVIMKTAPEKIHAIPVASVVLKELLKRFKVDNIVISDTGVKEGYMMLVAAGLEDGVPVDLADAQRMFLVDEPAPVKKKKNGGGKKQADTKNKANKSTGKKAETKNKADKQTGKKAEAKNKTDKQTGKKAEAKNKADKQTGKKSETKKAEGSAGKKAEGKKPTKEGAKDAVKAQPKKDEEGNTDEQ